MKAWMVADEETRVIAATELKTRARLAHRAAEAFRREEPAASPAMVDACFARCFDRLTSRFPEDLEEIISATRDIPRKMAPRRDSIVVGAQDVPAIGGIDALVQPAPPGTAKYVDHDGNARHVELDAEGKARVIMHMDPNVIPRTPIGGELEEMGLAYDRSTRTWRGRLNADRVADLTSFAEYLRSVTFYPPSAAGTSNVRRA